VNIFLYNGHAISFEKYDRKEKRNRTIPTNGKTAIKSHSPKLMVVSKYLNELPHYSAETQGEIPCPTY
jgi:hypothetical protein